MTAGAGRVLIVSGDDFGLTEGVSNGIVQAHDRGIVTATSVLALGPAFDATVPLLLSRPALDVGVHLAVVGEDPALLSPGAVPTLVDGSGQLAGSWRVFLRRALAGRVDVGQVRAEFAAQIGRVLETGLHPSHLDTHQHLHLWPPLATLLCDLATEHHIAAVRLPTGTTGWRRVGLAPLTAALRRKALRAGVVTPGRSVGLEEAGHLDAARLVGLIEAAGRTTAHAVELVCHPGADPDPSRARYRWGYGWPGELDALCARSVREAVGANGFTLGGFRDLGGAL